MQGRGGGKQPVFCTDCQSHPSGTWGSWFVPESTNSSTPHHWLPTAPVLPMPEPSALP